jgi:hypothetical protein
VKHIVKRFVFFLGCAVAIGAYAAGDGRIYRCGNEYTNTVSEPQAKKCKLVSGSNVTIVQSSRSAGTGKSTVGAGTRLEGADQRSKDSEAKFILEQELKKAESKYADLLKEYNNGEPEKLGPETRNNQKYLDRVAELKASIARYASDVEGLRRELGRLPAAVGNSSTAASK